MVSAGNKAKRLLSVNHTLKTIHQSIRTGGDNSTIKTFMPALIYGIEAWGCIKKRRNEGNRESTRKSFKKNF